ncbi:MAG TPA: hypothetical protein VHV52_12470 [Gaiellaceae bacterium]|nr:hypothetical protein [Gaiellaceae bacterium]
MLLAHLRPAAPSGAPHGSLAAWVVVAVVLAFIVMGGLVLASRR